MQQNPNEVTFDLIGIFRVIFSKWKFVLGLALAALVLSFVFCLFQTKAYTSKTVFIVKNPLLIDRNYVFRNTSYEHREFFAVPDDVDHIKTIGKADGMIWHVIQKFELDKVFNMPANDKLVKKIKSNFKILMEDTKNIELSYTDENPERAAAVVNEARHYLETTFLNYFLSTNKDLTAALETKVKDLKDSISSLDSSMVLMRYAINNYNQLLPTRGNTVQNTTATASAQNIVSLEKLSEITTLKDQYAKDVAQYQSLINEYRVMASGSIGIFYNVQEGFVPTLTSRPQTVIITIASFLGGLLFASLLVLFSAFYRKSMSK
jgi:uncharacterized protein involved in exopolysaccharide biosynthesis